MAKKFVDSNHLFSILTFTFFSFVIKAQIHTCKSLFLITSGKSLFPGQDFRWFKWEKKSGALATVICPGKSSRDSQVGETSVSYIYKLSKVQKHSD